MIYITQRLIMMLLYPVHCNIFQIIFILNKTVQDLLNGPIAWPLVSPLVQTFTQTDTDCMALTLTTLLDHSQLKLSGEI